MSFYICISLIRGYSSLDCSFNDGLSLTQNAVSLDERENVFKLEYFQKLFSTLVCLEFEVYLFFVCLFVWSFTHAKHWGMTVLCRSKINPM